MPPSDRTDISGDSDEFREERDFMPDVDCTLRCYLRASPPAVDPHAAQRMVDRLAAQGYYVAAIEEQEVDIAWYCAFFLAENVAGEPDPTARFAFTPAISDALRQRLAAFAIQQDELGFSAYSTSATHDLDEA